MIVYKFLFLIRTNVLVIITFVMKDQDYAITAICSDNSANTFIVKFSSIDYEHSSHF